MSWGASQPACVCLIHFGTCGKSNQPSAKIVMLNDVCESCLCYISFFYSIYIYTIFVSENLQSKNVRSFASQE